VRDLRLEPPEQIRLHGKGDKIRLCPLWAANRAAASGFLGAKRGGTLIRQGPRVS